MTPEIEEKLVAGVASIQATLEAQNKVLEIHGKSLDSVVYTLNGNGVPGLKQTVADHDSTLRNFRRMGWIVGSPILAAVGTGLVAAAIYLIRMVH